MNKVLIFCFKTFFIASSFAVSAQYCTSVGPASATDSNIEIATITGENSTSITFIGCPGVIGLDDQTLNYSVDLNANGSYTLNVLFGTCGNNYSGDGEAWIDFDGSETFDTSESIGTWAGTPPATLQNFSFTVPANCINGAVRMRVQQEEYATLPLDPCSNFSWGCIIDFSVNLSGGSPYCESVGPDYIGDSNVQQLDIYGEGGSSINYFGCPGVIGLDDQTANYSLQLSPAESYSLDVLFGTCGGNFPGAGEIWIDYDQNGSFDPIESIGTWQGSPPTTISTFNITVPATTPLGTSRMRVVHRESGAVPLDPCANFEWGSTTDFEVIFGNAINCSGYVGDSLQDSRIVGSLPFSETHDNSVCYTNNVTVYNSPDIFYQLVPADYGVDFFNVSLCGSTFDTYIQIQDKNGNVIAANDDYEYCSPYSELSFFSTGYDTLYVVVQGWNSAQGQYDISINDALLVDIEKVESAISIYPNPASGHIIIKGLNTEALITIKNLEGKTVYKGMYFIGNTLNLGDINAGLYFITVETTLSEHIQKLLIL